MADTAPERDLIELAYAERVELIVTLGDLQSWMVAPLAGLPVSKLGVYGNHCAGDYLELYGFENLHLRRVQLGAGGPVFGGFEGCHRYKRGPFQWEQDEAMAALAGFGPVDVFVAHSPPYGVNDHDYDRAHIGLLALNHYLDRHRPRYFLHGHTYPTTSTLVRRYGDTDIIYVHGEQVLDLQL